jgi:phenylacetate-CoA ligase
MFIFRAVNIYPSHIDQIISAIPGLGSEYQIHLSRDAAERGVMRILVEKGQGEPGSSTDPLAARLVQKIKRELMVTAQVEIVAYGSLPRSERKSQRVFDTRIQDSII